MRPVYAAAFVAISVPFLMGASSCDPPQTPKNQQAEKAKAAAASVTYDDNAEIDNLKRRLQLTSNPGLQGFIILLNESGQPILYESVKGKVSSGDKRLTDPTVLKHAGNGNGGSNIAVAPGPSDEGTYGHSGGYIFYWNQQDQYRQWNGKYLYSDKPFRLNVEPLAVAVAPENKR